MTHFKLFKAINNEGSPVVGLLKKKKLTQLAFKSACE